MATFVHRLTDLLVEEVSAVDLAANRRKIVVRKRHGGAMLGQAHHEGADGQGGAGAQWTVDVTKETAPAAPQGGQDATKPEPPAQDAPAAGGAQDGLQAAVWDTAYINTLPDSAFLYIAPGGDKDADGMTVPRSLRYFPVRDDKGALDLPHLRNALSRIPQADIPQAAKDKAQADAEALLAEATPAEGQAPAAETSSTMEAGEVAKALEPVLKAMDDSPEAKARDLLWMAMGEIERGALRSPEATDAVNGLLEALRGAVMKSADGDPKDGQEASSTGTDKGAAEVAEAVKLLQVALGRMTAGEPLDAEAHQAVARAREILASEAAPADEAAQADGEEMAADKDREPQAKAGAKMAAARRREFKTALDALIKLFEDIIPEAERGDWPKPTSKAAEPADRGELVKAQGQVDALQAELAKAQDQLKAVNVKLAKAQDRAVDSNMVPVDKASGDGETFSWGFDLNDRDN